MAVELSGKKISQVIRENLGDRKTYFVFASDIVKKSWLDWVIKNPAESGVKAVSAERFIAWDNFKTTFVISKEKGKVNIPPILRKVFVQNIIEENKSDGKKIFDYIISKDEKYRKNSLAFTDWMSRLLPSLKLWHNQYENFFLKTEGIVDDTENKDYDRLYSVYRKFLENYKFFEPSYLDSDFNPRGNRFIIIYPELFEDYAEFKKIFDSTDDIILLHARIEKKQTCTVYADARKELRRLCLKIRQLQKNGVDLRTVAVNVPNLENVRPYIEREFSLYSIPFIIRSGVPYLQNCGGDIFMKIQGALNSSFSYDSMRSLLLDGYIPWKNPDLNSSLIQAGRELRCICSYEENNHLVDVWETSLPKDSPELEHYRKIKSALNKFYTSVDFAGLHEAWKNFRDNFIDEELFQKINENDSDEMKQKKSFYALTNKILGQMITQLKEMQSIEEKFMRSSNLKVMNVLDFYIKEMKAKLYNPNTSKYGVNIFKYRVAASADFEYQFIINATQSDISVPFRKLSFITDDAKRKAFGLKDGESDLASKDASEYFVAAYGASNRENCETKFFISSSKTNFSGAAITHTSLDEFDTTKKGDPDEALDELDFVRENFLLDEKKFPGAKKEYSIRQKDAFDAWSRTNFHGDETSLPSENFNSIMKEAVGMKSIGDKPKISATNMNSYFRCPRKWAFQKLSLTEDSLDASITQANEIGTFYHRIIELLMRDFKTKMGGRIPAYIEGNENPWRFFDMDTDTIGGYKDISEKELKEIVGKKIFAALNEADKKGSAGFLKSPLALKVIESQKDQFAKNILGFLKNFCAFNPGTSSENEIIFAGMKIMGLELRRETETEDFIRHGFLDCVLCDGDGKAVIVDFKSGGMPSNTESRTNEDDEDKIVNFQMAVYVSLIENGDDEKENHEVVNGVFRKVNGSFESEEIINNKKKTRESFEATLKVLDEYSLHFASQMKSGNFEPENGSGKKILKRYIFDSFSECIGCGYKPICRSAFNVGKREI